VPNTTIASAAALGTSAIAANALPPWSDSEDDVRTLVRGAIRDDHPNPDWLFHLPPSPATAGPRTSTITGLKSPSEDRKTFIKSIPWPTRRPVVIIFSSVAFIIILLAVLLALGLQGELNNSTQDDDKPKPPTPTPTPMDPTQQLIIPANIANGEFGCSNYPARAPRLSTSYNTSSPVPGDKCPKTRYTLTECDVLNLLYPQTGGKSQPYLDDTVRLYIPHLITAMEMYDVNCSPERMSGFLATVRHETDGLLKMFQPADNGAGAVHMLPIHFAAVINDVPPMKKVQSKP
jgi:hypothetical protein